MKRPYLLCLAACFLLVCGCDSGSEDDLAAALFGTWVLESFGGQDLPWLLNDVEHNEQIYILDGQLKLHEGNTYELGMTIRLCDPEPDCLSLSMGLSGSFTVSDNKASMTVELCSWDGDAEECDDPPQLSIDSWTSDRLTLNYIDPEIGPHVAVFAK